MDVSAIKVIALDLDGTLTQHKSPLEGKTRETLRKLQEKYRLLMVGAGQCMRIFRQMGGYPVDIIGNYGLQYCAYDKAAEGLVTVYNHVLPCDREKVAGRIAALREALGLVRLYGEIVEFHDSGCVTFPLLGTRAPLDEKLACDPDRSLRRAMYQKVKDAFPEYRVFVGGSSSFDMAPAPYDKYYALDAWCGDQGLRHENVLYAGDDYGLGGNDEAVYLSDFPFLTIDDYRSFPEKMAALFRLEEPVTAR